MPSDAPRPRQFQSPKGTRDFYPQDLLRRRYIEKAWRDTSIRHGFEEIEGPTFEQAELYTVKSGEGILSEMFNVFSGKDPEEVAEVQKSGRAPLALRPEFTPTLARMYAARAGQLPKPTKWFTAGPYFRAEKPQRGRLREFCQWNVDVIGGDAVNRDIEAYDADTLATCVAGLVSLGLGFNDSVVRQGDRRSAADYFIARGVRAEHVDEMFSVFDKLDRLDANYVITRCEELGFSLPVTLADFVDEGTGRVVPTGLYASFREWAAKEGADSPSMRACQVLKSTGLDADHWVQPAPDVVRGLAYYTGMVFEVHEVSGQERAICGGGRYDNLIELFGGPPTPAVGFGMGDVVLGNLLQDKGLMPEGAALLQALSAPSAPSAPSASLRPDVFVIANEKEESQKALRPLVAKLRRGVESPEWSAKSNHKPWDADRYATPPLHARHSYKATKNIGKLLQEAGAQHARHAAIIEDAGTCTLKNLDTREEQKSVPLDDLGRRVAKHG
ncbi:MAG: histidine--tRNA ligase [Phycisphaerales bacterium]